MYKNIYYNANLSNIVFVTKNNTVSLPKITPGTKHNTWILPNVVPTPKYQCYNESFLHIFFFNIRSNKNQSPMSTNIIPAMGKKKYIL